MTLISILIGLALDYFLSGIDRIRNFSWFDLYSQQMELRCSKYSFWNGPVGLLITLAVPLMLLMGVAYGVGEISVYLTYLLALAVFIYSLGPELNKLLKSYIDAIREDDEAARLEIEKNLISEEKTEDTDAERIIRSILVCAHEHIFGVIFWFCILGMFGALLYCLVVRMEKKFNDIHGAYADAIRNLHRILMWPSARLLALGFALSGSLVDALEAWRGVTGYTLECNEDVIGRSGLGALQYESLEPEAEATKDNYLYCIQEAQSLVNRTLIIWLTALGIMTLGGWLA